MFGPAIDHRPRNTITARPSPELAFDDTGNDYRVTLAARKLAGCSAWARIDDRACRSESRYARGALSDTLRINRQQAESSSTTRRNADTVTA
jgi:hypothetical protein